jgi:hypothetical protein
LLFYKVTNYKPTVIAIRGKPLSSARQPAAPNTGTAGQARENPFSNLRDRATLRQHADTNEGHNA